MRDICVECLDLGVWNSRGSSTFSCLISELTDNKNHPCHWALYWSFKEWDFSSGLQFLYLCFWVSAALHCQLIADLFFLIEKKQTEQIIDWLRWKLFWMQK